MDPQTEPEEDSNQHELHTFSDKKAYFQKIGGCQETISSMDPVFRKL